MPMENVNHYILAIFWVVALSLFSAIHLISSRIYSITGQKILDCRINYSPEEAYDALKAMGDEGRRLYLRLNGIDFVFPLFFYPALALTIVYLLKIFSVPEIYTLLAIVPLIGGIADLGENICIREMLENFNSRLTGVAKIANFFTLTKYSMIFISFLIIVILVIFNLTGK